MRLLRLKLAQPSKDYLKKIAYKMAVSDTDFIEDMYCLVRLQGRRIPADSDVAELAAKYSKALNISANIAAILLRKRKQVLKSTSQTGMFLHHLQNPIENDLEFTERLLGAFRLLHHKLQQSQCLSCSLYTKCQFGQQYAKAVRSIDVVVDPNYAKKVHEDCPHYPAIEFTNEIQKAASFITNAGSPHGNSALKSAVKHSLGSYMNSVNITNALTDEAAVHDTLEELSGGEEDAPLLDDDEALAGLDLDNLSDEDVLRMRPATMEGSRFNKVYMTKHAGGQATVLNEAAIQQLTVSNLMLYEIARKLDDVLGKHKKGQYKPVEKLTKQRKQANIKSIQDVTKVTATQHALPTEVFERKLVKRELVKHQQEEKEAKKQLLYLLIDTSDSMTSVSNLNSSFGFLTRAALAASFGIALVRRVCSDEGIVFVRMFEGAPDKLQTARTKDEFGVIEQYLANCAFNGYSTNIPSAIRTAAADITSAKDELSKAEILMITDAGDSIKPEVQVELRSLLGDISLNILDVAGNSSAPSTSARTALESLSDNYYSVDAQSTLDKMVNLVGGKKKNATSRSYES